MATLLIVKIDLLFRDHLAGDIILDEVWGVLYLLLLCGSFGLGGFFGFLLGLSGHFRLWFWRVFSHVYFYMGKRRKAFLATKLLEILGVPHKSLSLK